MKNQRLTCTKLTTDAISTLMHESPRHHRPAAIISASARNLSNDKMNAGLKNGWSVLNGHSHLEILGPTLLEEGKVEDNCLFWQDSASEAALEPVRLVSTALGSSSRTSQVGTDSVKKQSERPEVRLRVWEHQVMTV